MGAPEGQDQGVLMVRRSARGLKRNAGIGPIVGRMGAPEGQDQGARMLRREAYFLYAAAFAA
jgi:hypothetical protein